MGGGSIVGGRYELVRKLAEGGMGSVWEARHTLSKKIVALKILAPETVRDETTRTRFLREVAAPAQIGHDGIVEVYDAGFDPALGALFVAMELLSGETMRALLQRGRIDPRRLLHIVLEMLSALAAAHDAGFVHRDLKPENVFLHVRKGGAEQVKILDFGIARNVGDETSVTQSGIAMGTPHYMSPEQASSARDVTPPTDVWAVGVILYEGFAHDTPFRGETLASLVVDVLTRPHRPLLEAAPQTPPGIAAIVDRCLEKDPRRRPQSGAELLGLLRAAGDAAGLTHGSESSSPGTPLPSHPTPPGRPTAPTSALGPGGTVEIVARPGVPTVPSAATVLPAPRGSEVSASGSVVPATTGIPVHLSTPAPITSAAPMTTAAPSPPPPQERSWLWPAAIATAAFVVVVGVLSLGGLGLLAYLYQSRPLHGSLASGDGVLAGGQLFDTYEYAWSAGGRVQLFAHSPTFETHIILSTPSGRQLDSTDDRGARIDMVLPESGTYRVIVTSRQAFTLGDYELEVDEP